VARSLLASLAFLTGLLAAEEPATPTRPPNANVQPPALPEKAYVEPVESGNLLVLASVDMLRNDFVMQGPDYRGNVLFLQNAIENFGLGAVLGDMKTERLPDKEDGSRTVSPAMKEILSNLEDEVHVAYYVSHELPGPMGELRKKTEDLLSELRDASARRLRYSIVRPEEKAADFASKKVAEYEAAKRKNETPQEPEPFQTIEQIFGGAKPPTAEEIREKRDKTAANLAAAEGRSKDDVYLDLLRQEWRQNYLQKLEQEGIEPFPIVERNGSSKGKLKVYSAIRIQYLDKDPEIIGVHGQVEDLEYELARRILKLTAGKKPTIAFFDGRKRPPLAAEAATPSESPPGDYSALLQYLQQHFDIHSVNLEEGDSIDDLVRRLMEDRAAKAERDSGEEKKDGEKDRTVKLEDVRLIQCLVVAQPVGLEPRQVYEINRAVSLGVPTIFLVSRFSMDISQKGLQSGIPIALLETGLEDFLKKTGLELGPDILASNLGGEVNLPMNTGGLRLIQARPLPVCVQAEKDSIDGTSAITRQVQSLTFPATCGLEVLEKKAGGDGLKMEVLARTSKETWSTKLDPRPQNPLPKHAASGTSVFQYQKDLVMMKNPEEYKDFIAPMPLAVLVRGRIPFTFQGEAVPEWKKK